MSLYVKSSPGEFLKFRVESCAEQELLHNPIFRETRLGHLTESHLGFYHFNLKYIMAKTPGHLKLAAQMAAELGELDCAESFQKRIPEEMGHDLWAAQDLASLNLNPAVKARLHVLPAIKKLNEFILTAIKADPLNYAVYALWAEYFTVLVVPPFVADLEKYCGISPQVMTVLTRHAEIDKDHVADDVAIINQLLSKRLNYNLNSFFKIVDWATEHYRNFAEQILEAHNEIPLFRNSADQVRAPAPLG